MLLGACYPVVANGLVTCAGHESTLLSVKGVLRPNAGYFGNVIMIS